MTLILFNFESNKNSQALAFALDWVDAIAKNIDKLYVVSLRCKDFQVANNVEVHCINQDKKNRIETIFSIWKTLYKIHKKDKNIDGYFVHMAHYFVPIIYPFAKYFNQKIVLWYAHKSTPFSLKIAGTLANKIFSISSKSMRLQTNKFEPIGHGIDTKNRFILKDNFRNKIKNIVTVGRISKVKNTHLIIEEFLKLNRDDLYLYVVGDTLTQDDKLYFDKIKNLIPKDKNKNIIFTGSISFENIINIYNNIDLAVNLGDGALDKAIIEPMAMGIPVITSNDSAKEIFTHLDGSGVYLLNNKDELKNILEFLVDKELNFNKDTLRAEIVNNHSLNRLAKKIIDEFK